MPRWLSIRPRTVLVGAAMALCMAWLWREIGGEPDTSAEERVVIPKGSAFTTAADSLRAHHVITSATLLRLYARGRGEVRAIKPGTYAFVRHSGYARVLDALVSGRGLVHTVTVPEGFDLRDITPMLARALNVSEDSIRAAVTDTAWKRRLDVPAPTLEGYLFPATYAFPEGTSARDAVVEMLSRFEAGWKPEWNDRLKDMALTRHAAMTMAAIVEKEAKVPEERPLIAAVYWNRVKKGMRLQADPTVQYALPAHVDRVLYKDLAVTSAYNTYRNAGLPPGPIASPGAASIAAALSPANVPYLYFVARPDGHHVFTTTFAEHQAAIATLRRERARAARAAGSTAK